MLPTPPHNTSPFSQTTSGRRHGRTQGHVPTVPAQQLTMPHATNTHPLNPQKSKMRDQGGVRMEASSHPYAPLQQVPLHIPTRSRLRIVAAVIVIVLAIAMYFIWQTPTTTPSTGVMNHAPTQTISTSSFTTNTSSSPIYRGSPAQGRASPPPYNADGSSGGILVYVVGAVKHPGVYTLPANARVYQLLQAAGGPLPNANLVALNMAAKLNDGQEVYVALIGETPPATGAVSAPDTGSSASGSLININTASVEQMRMALHISSKTAQKIIDYRLQHGPYTSVDQLLQVVSRSIYDKIKDLVTVS